MPTKRHKKSVHIHSDYLREHLREVHAKIKDYACDQCDYRFPIIRFHLSWDSTVALIAFDALVSFGVIVNNDLTFRRHEDSFVFSDCGSLFLGGSLFRGSLLFLGGSFFLGGSDSREANKQVLGYQAQHHG